MAQANPNDPRAWLQLTRGLIDHGDLERAYPALLRAHALSADHAVYLVQASRLYRKLGNHTEGLNAARRAQHLAPDNREAVVEVALHLVEAGDHHAAALSLRVAARRFPDDGHIQLALARTYLQVQRPKDALRHVEKAHNLKAPPADVQRTLARVFRDLGRGEDELKALRAVVSLDRTDVESAILLGEGLALQGRRQEAAAILEQVAEHPPSNATTLVKLGHALTEAHALVPAVRCLREAIRISPDYPQAHFQLGLALHVGGGLKEAVNSLRTAVAIDPRESEFGYQLGITLRDAGRLREAASALIAAAAAAPNDARIQEVLTDILAALKTPSSGVHAAKQKATPRENTNGGFSGDLALFSVPELLEFLMNQRASGDLVVSSPSGEGRLSLHEGSLISATYPGGKTLGDLLVDDELITRTDLKQRIVRPQDMSQDQVVASVVLTQKLVERSSVEDLLRRQIIEGVQQLVSWSDGAVTFQRQAGADVSPAVVVDTRFALLEAVRLMDEQGR